MFEFAQSSSSNTSNWPNHTQLPFECFILANSSSWITIIFLLSNKQKVRQRESPWMRWCELSCHIWPDCALLHLAVSNKVRVTPGPEVFPLPKLHAHSNFNPWGSKLNSFYPGSITFSELHSLHHFKVTDLLVLKYTTPGDVAPASRERCSRLNKSSRVKGWGPLGRKG